MERINAKNCMVPSYCCCHVVAATAAEANFPSHRVHLLL